MELNPPHMPRSPVADQSLSGNVKSSNTAISTTDHGPALRLASSRSIQGEESRGGSGAVDQAASSHDLKKAEQLREQISDRNMQLSTYHDDASGRSVLEVTDQATGQVVTQYPSDELLRLYAALREPLVDRNV